MKLHKILLLTILAGIYSSILNQFEEDFGINRLICNVTLSLAIFLTGLIFYRIDRKADKSNIENEDI
ncbi:hypothetical protein [Niallia oryzisoli]|uniref:hypothetical protein n=1 Tax=Niallia oryzisoli TaxID=1737571 RepID=UPI003734F319